MDEVDTFTYVGIMDIRRYGRRYYIKKLSLSCVYHQKISSDIFYMTTIIKLSVFIINIKSVIQYGSECLKLHKETESVRKPMLTVDTIGT